MREYFVRVISNDIIIEKSIMASNAMSAGLKTINFFKELSDAKITRIVVWRWQTVVYEVWA